MKPITIILLFLSHLCCAQTQTWKAVDTKSNASFRGLSVVDDSVAWVSGSAGWVGRSVNGARDWTFKRVKGYEQCDFRTLYAFDALNAIIANAGSPAYILRTADGGSTWNEVYKNTDTAAFFDGIDFWTQKVGLVYGDPINHHMQVLKTTDRGHTWRQLSAASSPLLQVGEASFAASGTCIRCINRRSVAIATGGSVSRLWISRNRGRQWKAINTPILQGESSTGIFSFLPLNERHWIIAGGDYKRDTFRLDNLFSTFDAGETWDAPRRTTRGYRECLLELNRHDGVKPYQTIKSTIIAAGPGGIDISYNSGTDWQSFSEDKQVHVIKKSRQGNLVVMAGGRGKLAYMER
ncbi:MAG: oxidoreductase [Taibaiella sp.]|nr:oxidoreductase [Taibaiella sp.]